MIPASSGPRCCSTRRTSTRIWRGRLFQQGAAAGAEGRAGRCVGFPFTVDEVGAGRAVAQGWRLPQRAA
eukprot:1480851-Lingulodinium_polyedra.AAC.1